MLSLLPWSKVDPENPGGKFLLPLNYQRASDVLWRPRRVYVRRTYQEQFKRELPSYLSCLVDTERVDVEEAQSKVTRRAVIYITESKEVDNLGPTNVVIVDFSSALAHCILS